MKARERKLALLGRLAEWIGCFCRGILVLDVNRHALERTTGSCPMPISIELAVISPEQCAVCRGDAQCQSLTSISVESLVSVWDSPIPMSMLSAVSLESHPAGRNEV